MAAIAVDGMTLLELEDQAAQALVKLPKAKRGMLLSTDLGDHSPSLRVVKRRKNISPNNKMLGHAAASRKDGLLQYNPSPLQKTPQQLSLGATTSHPVDTSTSGQSSHSRNFNNSQQSTIQDQSTTTYPSQSMQYTSHFSPVYKLNPTPWQPYQAMQTVNSVKDGMNQAPPYQPYLSYSMQAQQAPFVIQGPTSQPQMHFQTGHAAGQQVQLVQPQIGVFGGHQSQVLQVPPGAISYESSPYVRR